MGKGEGEGELHTTTLGGGGLRVGEGMGGMSAIASPKKVRDGKLPPRHPHGRDHRPCQRGGGGREGGQEQGDKSWETKWKTN